MMNFEWNQETALKVRKEEGIEEGIGKGLIMSVKNLMDSLNMSLEQAMDVLKIPNELRADFANQMAG